MHRKLIFAAAIAFAGTLPAAVAIAQGYDTPTKVTFCGTAQRVDPHSCLLVNPSEPIGHTYDITGAKPEPNIGKMIAGSGTSAGKSTCKDAIRLTKVKWSYAAACPLVEK
jgi:hypothetical protein